MQTFICISKFGNKFSQTVSIGGNHIFILAYNFICRLTYVKGGFYLNKDGIEDKSMPRGVDTLVEWDKFVERSGVNLLAKSGDSSKKPFITNF